MQIFKIHRPQKSGISKIYLHCRPNFWTPRFLRFVNFENLHLHKFEYNRIFDIRRNFAQSLNWRKKQKCASLKKVRPIHFFLGGSRGSGIYIFSGEPHFSKRGHKIFVFIKKPKARCACGGLHAPAAKISSGGTRKIEKWNLQEHWNREKNHEDILATEGHQKTNNITECKHAQRRI